MMNPYVMQKSGFEDTAIAVCQESYVTASWWGNQRVIAPPCGAFDLGLAVSVPLPIVTWIFVSLWFQSRLT